MPEQLELPFLQLPELAALLEKIGRGDATDLAIWCADHAIGHWSWDGASWRSVVDAARPNSILLGVVVSYAAVFWLRSLERFQKDAGVWILAQADRLGPADDQVLWDSCCVAALWWSRCRWPDGVRHLLFLSRDPAWVNALMFRWLLPPASTPWGPYSCRARVVPISGDLFESPPSTALLPSAPICSEPSGRVPDQIATIRQQLSGPSLGAVGSFSALPALGLPIPSAQAHEIRDIMEQASLDRTGLFDRLLAIPPFVAVCLDEPSFLFARAARIGLVRVLESLERAGLSTAPVIAEVAEVALLNGRKEVWEWAIRRPVDDVRQAVSRAYHFNWVVPPGPAGPQSARWLVDWVAATSGLMSDHQWFEWSSHLAQTLLLHSDSMPPSFGTVCAILLEPKPVDRGYIMRALLGPLGLAGSFAFAPEMRLAHDRALGLVLDAWPVPINTLEESVTPEVWARLDFHPRVQRVLLARCSGLSGQEEDPSEIRSGRRRM